MNKVILMGNVCKNVEVSTTQSGKEIAKFTIAVYRSKDESEFVNCIAFNKTAELLRDTPKGTKILVEGSIKNGSYEAKDGIKRYTSDIWVNSVEFTSKKSTSASTTMYKDDMMTQIDRGDDDIPF